MATIVGMRGARVVGSILQLSYGYDTFDSRTHGAKGAQFAIADQSTTCYVLNDANPPASLGLPVLGGVVDYLWPECGSQACSHTGDNGASRRNGCSQGSNYGVCVWCRCGNAHFVFARIDN